MEPIGQRNCRRRRTCGTRQRPKCLAKVVTVFGPRLAFFGQLWTGNPPHQDHEKLPLATPAATPEQNIMTRLCLIGHTCGRVPQVLLRQPLQLFLLFRRHAGLPKSEKELRHAWGFLPHRVSRVVRESRSSKSLVK